MPIILLQQAADFNAQLVFGAKVILNVLTFTLCIFACFTDLTKGRVPNWLTMPFLLAGMAVQYVVGGWAQMDQICLSESVGGLLVGGGFMLLLYFIGGLGGGDVKLFAAIGALKGQAFTMQALLNSCLVGGVLALFQIVFRWLTFNPAAEAALEAKKSKIQVIPDEEKLTVEQKKELARKKREEEATTKKEDGGGKEETTKKEEVSSHSEDPEAEELPASVAENTSESQKEESPKAKDLEKALGGEEERKQGIPFGFAISLGVIVTYIISPLI